MEKAADYMNATKSGRAFNGAHMDAGKIVHIVKRGFPSWNKSLCGTEPGLRGNGWHEETTQGATCDKCIAKFSHFD